jgi:hypothetical protein
MDYDNPHWFSLEGNQNTKTSKEAKKTLRGFGIGILPILSLIAQSRKFGFGCYIASNPHGWFGLAEEYNLGSQICKNMSMKIQRYFNE